MRLQTHGSRTIAPVKWLEYRRGLAEMLATDGNIEVIGEAENGAVALELAREALLDVIILDLVMPVVEAGRRWK